MRELSDEEVGLGGAPVGLLSDADVGLADPTKKWKPFTTSGGNVKKRDVGVGEATARGVGSTFAEQGNVLGLAAAAPAVAADWVANLFRDKPSTAAQDFMFRNVVDPTKEAVDFYAQKPNEEFGVDATVGNVAGRIGGMLPSMVGAGGAQASVMAPRILSNLGRGAVVAQPTFALPSTTTRAQQLLEAGVDPATVAKASASNLGFNTAMGALPMAAAGGVLKRATTGGAINLGTGIPSRAAEGEILGPENANVALPAFGGKEMTMDAGIGAAMAAALGPRVPMRYPAIDVPKPGPDILPGAQPFERPPPGGVEPTLDPAAQAKAVSDALFPQPQGEVAPLGVPVQRTPNRPAEAPALELVPGKQQQFQQPLQPDVSEPGGRVAVAPELDVQSAPGPMRREVGEPRIEPTEANITALVEKAMAENASMKPNVPMKLLHTIDTAARESGVEKQIYPRIIEGNENVKEPAPASGGEGSQLSAPDIFGGNGPAPSGPKPKPAAAAARSADGGVPAELGQRGEALKADAAPQEPRFEFKGRAGTEFLQAIKKAGGLSSKDTRDIGSDKAFHLNKRLPGLLRKDGMAGDSLVEWALDNGYLQEHEIARAEQDNPGGAIEVAWELVRKAMNDEHVFPIGDERLEHMEAQRQRDEDEYDAHRAAENAKTDAEDAKAAEDAAFAVSPEEHAAWVGEKVGEDSQLIRLSDQAEKANPQAFEDLATRTAGDDVAFRKGLQEIIDNGKKSEDGPDTKGDENAARDAGGEREGAAERPDFELGAPTSASLRASHDAAERARAERERVAKAPPPEEFTMTGSDRPADEAAARGQQELPDTGNSRGTLFSGFPINDMLAFAKETGERIVGPMKDWQAAAVQMKDNAKSVAEAFGAKISSLKGQERAPAGGESLPAAVARTLFYNVHSHLKSFGEVWKSPTIGKVADMIYSTAGKAQEGQSLHEATGQHVTQRQSDLSNIVQELDSLMKSSGVKQEQIVKMVENQASRQGKAGEIAKRIADWLKVEREYQVKSGVEIGEEKNYFPRVYDRAKIVPQRAAFEADATRAYEKMGLSGKDARDAARAFWFRKAYGSDGSPTWHAEGGGSKEVKARELTPEAANELRKWRTESIGDTLAGYLNNSSRRAEIASRFGDKWEKWDEMEKQIIKEAPDIGPEQLKELRSMVASAVGLRESSMGASAHTATQYLRLWTTLATMPKAALSSIAETWIPLARAQGDLAVTVNHLRNVLFENTTSLLSQAVGMGRTEKMQRAFDFAEDIGALSQSPLSNLMADRWMGSGVQSKAVSAISSKFFRLNMLEQVTNWQRAISVDAARIFLRRQAQRVADGEKSAGFYLRELGVPESKVKDFSEYVRKMGDALPDASVLTGEHGTAYRNALVRFTDQSIQRPTSAARPSWANTEWGAVVFHLQGFANSFHKNVLLRQANLAKEAVTGDGYGKAERMAMMGGMIPGLMMSAATAGLVWELRDRLYNKEPRERTTQARVERAISGAGLTGAVDPYLQMIGGIRYHRSPAAQAGGPSFGAVDTILTGTAEYWLNNSDKTNAAERKASDAFYQWGIEPAATLVLAATPAPVSPLTQALTVLALPASKQAFTDAVAGPKKKKKNEKPIRGIFEPK